MLEEFCMLNKYGNIQRDRMAAILSTILNAKQITRNGLSEALHLSPSSIVKYINTLLEQGLVREGALQESTGGRRSIFLEFDPEAGVNIALVFNLSSIHGALVNPAGKIITERSVPTVKGIYRDKLLTLLFTLITDLQRDAEKINKRIFGIGLGMGDHIDMKTGISHKYLLAREWKEVPLKALIEKRFNLPFFLINDIDAGALGEKFYGRGVAVDNFVCIWLSETVGMGMVLNNNLYFGKKGIVGEIGHTKVIPGGDLCTCGNRGCLETVATESYILKKCRAGMETGVYTSIAETCGHTLSELAIEDVITAAKHGDRFAQNIFLEVASYIGDKCTDVVNILNPDLLILRGSIIDGNPFLFKNIKRIIKAQALSIIADTVRIVHTDETSDIRIPGVSSYILMNYFRQ